jgi:hypothetical protein
MSPKDTRTQGLTFRSACSTSVLVIMSVAKNLIVFTATEILRSLRSLRMTKEKFSQNDVVPIAN